MQMCVIQFDDRPGTPLYHLEHFIEGKYIKYNSNSGFVEDSLRYTPQVRLYSVLVFGVGRLMGWSRSGSFVTS